VCVCTVREERAVSAAPPGPLAEAAPHQASLVPLPPQVYTFFSPLHIILVFRHFCLLRIRIRIQIHIIVPDLSFLNCKKHIEFFGSCVPQCVYLNLKLKNVRRTVQYKGTGDNRKFLSIK
jgi:hypothetical protein